MCLPSVAVGFDSGEMKLAAKVASVGSALQTRFLLADYRHCTNSTVLFRESSSSSIVQMEDGCCRDHLRVRSHCPRHWNFQHSLGLELNVDMLDYNVLPSRAE